MSEAALISEEYRKMQQQLHENPKYGVASVQFAPLAAQVIEAAADVVAAKISRALRSRELQAGRDGFHGGGRA